MNLVQSLQIANDVKRIQKLAGLQAIYPYKPEQFAEAVLALHNHIGEQLDRIKLLEAQLRAANARAAKHA